MPPSVTTVPSSRSSGSGGRTSEIQPNAKSVIWAINIVKIQEWNLKGWRIKVHFRFYNFMNSCWDVNRPFCSLIFAPSWYYNWGAHAWTLYRQNDRNLACSYFYILFVFYASLPNLIKLLPVIDNNTSLHLCSGN